MAVLVLVMLSPIAVGQNEFPETILPQAAGENVSKINISPNPVHGNTFFYIEIDSCTHNSINNIIIYNSAGFIMQNKSIELREGNNRFLINISGFQPGYYTVRMIGKNIPSFSFSEQLLVGQ